MSNENKSKYVYGDLFIIDANLENFKSLLPSNNVDSGTVYMKIRYESLIYFTKEIKHENVVIWNENCTFIFPENVTKIVGERISFSLIYRVPKAFSFFRDTCIAKCHLNLFSQHFNTLLETTLSFDNSCCKVENLKLFVPAQNIETKLQEKDFARVVLYLSKDEKGILSDYGKPMFSIPYRLMPGDCILVSTTTPLGAGLQALTWSKWDHVALVTAVRSNPNKYRWFESSSDGVELYSLDKTLAMHLESGCVIGVRRLLIKRSPLVLESLYSFTEQAVGKPYKQEYLQLFRSFFRANQSDDNSSYFCSQLVADAYQKMGVLKTDVLSSNFLPKHFGKIDSDHLAAGRFGELVCFRYERDPEEK